MVVEISEASKDQQNESATSVKQHVHMRVHVHVKVHMHV